MADPRNTTSLEGLITPYVTLIPDGSTIVWDVTQPGGAAATMIGKAVSLSANSTVQLTNDGDAVVGKLISVENDLKCTVQWSGSVGLPGGSGASLTLGKKIVGALGAASARGYIREVATATAAELGKERGSIIDATDTTNVYVLL